MDLNDMYTFAEYDKGSRKVTLQFTDDSDLTVGLHRAIVTLDDGKLQKEYSLYTYVSPEESEFDDGKAPPDEDD